MAQLWGMLAVFCLKQNVNFDMKVLWSGPEAWEFGEGLNNFLQ